MAVMQIIINDGLEMFGEPVTETGKYNQDNFQLTLRLANRKYVETCKRTHCSRDSQTISLIANTREYALPADFVASKKVRYSINGKVYFLNPIREDEATDIGCRYPESYYLIGREFIGINPLITADLDLTLIYAKRPTEDIGLDESPSMVPDDYHYIISEGLAAELFLYDKGDKSSGFIKWNKIYLSHIREMKAELKDGTNADKYYNIT